MTLLQEQRRTCSAEINLDNSIITIHLLAEHQSSVADAQANLQEIQTLTAGRACPCLLDLRWAVPLAQEVRAVYIQHINSTLALLVCSTQSRILGNIVFTAPHVRVFDNESRAYKWLHQFI